MTRSPTGRRKRAPAIQDPRHRPQSEGSAIFADADFSAIEARMLVSSDIYSSPPIYLDVDTTTVERLRAQYYAAFPAAKWLRERIARAMLSYQRGAEE